MLFPDQRAEPLANSRQSGSRLLHEEGRGQARGHSNEQQAESHSPIFEVFTRANPHPGSLLRSGRKYGTTAFKRRAASEALSTSGNSRISASRRFSWLGSRRSSRCLHDNSVPNASSAARVGQSSAAQMNQSRSGPCAGAGRRPDAGKARRRSWRISDSLRMSGSKSQASPIPQADDAFGRGGWKWLWSESAGAANHAEPRLHTLASSRPAAASFTRSARRAGSGSIRQAVSSLFGRPSYRHPIKWQGSKSPRDENLGSEEEGSGPRSLQDSVAGTHSRSRRGPVASKGNRSAGTSALSAILPYAFSPSLDEEGGRNSDDTGCCFYRRRCSCCLPTYWVQKEPPDAAIHGAAAGWIRKEADLEAPASRQCLRSVADTAETAHLQKGARPSRFRVGLNFAFSKIRFGNQSHHLHEQPPSQLDKADAVRAQRSTAAAAAFGKSPLSAPPPSHPLLPPRPIASLRPWLHSIQLPATIPSLPLLPAFFVDASQSFFHRATPSTSPPAHLVIQPAIHPSILSRFSLIGPVQPPPSGTNVKRPCPSLAFATDSSCSSRILL